jgi:N-methylhydantoinase A
LTEYAIGTDIGGTFTDCAVVDARGEIIAAKAPSTPEDFSVGFFDAVGAAAEQLSIGLDDLLARSTVLVHATTAGTNAVVERRGSPVGLLTTAGHGEALQIMRGAGRTKGVDLDEMLFIPGTYKPAPLVPHELIREISERVDSRGRVVVALDDDEVRHAIRSLLDAGAQAITVSLLWSVVNPAHELRVLELVAEEAPSTFASASHVVAAQVGEYARTVATVVNGYIGPLMNSYTGQIVASAADRGYAHPVLFAQCLGGAASHETIDRVPLYTLGSGPVSGIVACAHLGDRFGYPNIISADMGGTTFDVSVIAGGTPERRETTVINQYEMYLPTVDVASIGAGGGSIAWIDRGKATLRVGPRSAGAVPGPICYGRGGTEPTVTDADVVLGIVNPEGFLGGRRRLDRRAAQNGIASLGAELAMSAEETAAGIIDVIDNLMAEKIRRMTVNGGHDPRDFVVFAFGGAGPMHASAFARELGAPAVVIPLGDTASVLSAVGTVSADVGHVYDRQTPLRAPFDMIAVERSFTVIEELARSTLRNEGFDDDRIVLRRVVAMKYGAQVFDIEIASRPGEPGDELVARFEQEYEGRYGKGSGYAPAGIEILRLRVYAAGRLPRPELGRRARHGSANGGLRPVSTSRPVWWRDAGGWVDTPVFSQIEHAPAGTRIEGPAVVDCPDTTVPIRPGQRLEVDEFGNLILAFDATGA